MAKNIDCELYVNSIDALLAEAGNHEAVTARIVLLFGRLSNEVRQSQQ